MKATGIVRRIDDLGRVVIPRAIRHDLHFQEGDKLELFTEDDSVILKKHSAIGPLSNYTASVARALCKKHRTNSNNY